MDLNLNVLQLASALASHAAARQQVISENIAHADTPGYRARDVDDFAATLEGTPAFAARTTRPGHIALRRRRGAGSRRTRSPPSAPRPRTATPSASRTR